MTEPTIEVGVEVDLSGAGLTLNEIIEVEEISGERVHERSGVYLRAVAWVTGRKTNPNLTLEEAGQLEVRFDG